MDVIDSLSSIHFSNTRHARYLKLITVRGNDHCIATDRVRSTTEGYVFTGVCLLTGGGGRGTQGTYLPGTDGWGRGYPDIPAPQGTYPLGQVPTRGRGTPRYLPPSPDLVGVRARYLGPPAKVLTLPAKVPTPQPGLRGRGYPRYLPPWPRYLPLGIGQHLKYLVRRDRYAFLVRKGVQIYLSLRTMNSKQVISHVIFACLDSSSLVVARQNVPLTSVLTNFTLGS